MLSSVDPPSQCGLPCRRLAIVLLRVVCQLVRHAVRPCCPGSLQQCCRASRAWRGTWLPSACRQSALARQTRPCRSAPAASLRVPPSTTTLPTLQRAIHSHQSPTRPPPSLAAAAASSAKPPNTSRTLGRLALLGGVGLAAAYQLSSDESPVTAFLSSLPFFPDTAECTTGVTTRKWHYYRGTPNSSDMTDLRLISGSSHPALAAEIAGYLGLPLTSTTIRPFSDGEVGIAINDNVRETHVFVIAPVSKPVNDTLVELLLLVATLRRSSAAEITAVIPYFGYSRQDRKMTSRVPISAADVALMLDEMGVDRVISVDLHTGQIQGFFPPRIAVENLEAVNIGALYFSEKELRRPVIIAPSSGSVPRAKKFREVLSDKWQGGASGGGGGGDVELAMLIERQYHDIDEGGRLIGVASQLDLVGEVADRDVIMVEDIVDTANTLTSAAFELKRQGARNIYAFASHGLFSDNALTKIKQSPLTEVVVTNTVPLQEADGESGGKVTQLTLAPLLAETIKRIHLKESILSLFDVHAGAVEGGETKTKKE